MQLDQLTEFLGNHPWLFSALAAVIALLIINELMISFSGDQRLLPLIAVRLINDRDAQVLDIRQPADFKKGHILNALNIPMNRIDARIDELGKDKEKPILVYCALGTLAPQACAVLKKHGFASSHALKGGLTSWQSAGLPVTKQ